MLRGGHVFVAADALDREPVGEGAIVAGGAVPVMDVEHEVMFRRLVDGFRNPGCLLLRADIHEPDFHRFDAPFFVKREEHVALFPDLPAIHIGADSEALFGRVADHFVEIEVGHANGGRVAGRGILRALPLPVESDVLEPGLPREIHDGLGVGCGERGIAHGLAGADPGSVGEGGRRVEVSSR